MITKNVENFNLEMFQFEGFFLEFNYLSFIFIRKRWGTYISRIFNYRKT